jgi:hypothetical protein
MAFYKNEVKIKLKYSLQRSSPKYLSQILAKCMLKYV